MTNNSKSKKLRRVLVTGGAGFIGNNFCRYWLQKYPDDVLINLDFLTYAGSLSSCLDLEQYPQYHFVRGDINNTQLLNSLMADIDLVVHFAAESHVDRSIADPDVFLKTNVLGTHTLLATAVKYKTPHFHHISTDEVFGSLDLDSKDQFCESTPYSPRSPYSASKASSDHLVRAYGETYGLPFTITNCSNNYGEYQFPEKFIPLAITNILENVSIPIYGNGLQVRDWLYVQDHCSAIESVILHGEIGETYLVGGMEDELSNLQIAELILKLMNQSLDQIEFIKDRPGHDQKYSVNWQKIHSELGWSPSVTLEEGLQRTIDWYTKNFNWWQAQKNRQKEYFLSHYNKEESK